MIEIVALNASPSIPPPAKLEGELSVERLPFP
jgi:hypothetical protein